MPKSLMESVDEKGWCVYILKCRNNYYYTGITNNLVKRLEDHGKGKGSKFVRAFRPFELVKVIRCHNGSEARKLEAFIKKLKREKKLEYLGIRVS